MHFGQAPYFCLAAILSTKGLLQGGQAAAGEKGAGEHCESRAVARGRAAMGPGHPCGEDGIPQVGEGGQDLCPAGDAAAAGLPAHHTQTQKAAWPHLQRLLDAACPGLISFPGLTLGGLWCAAVRPGG